MVDRLVSQITEVLSDYVTGQPLIQSKTRIAAVLARYSITNTSKDIVPVNERFPAFYRAFFVSKKIEGRSEQTLKQYKLVLDKFFVDVSKQADSITQNDIRCWLYMAAQNTGASSRTMDTKRAVLMSFFSWAEAEGYIDRNPCRNVKRIVYERKQRQPLTSEQLQMVRAACSDNREKAIIEVLYSTGCRVSELSGIDVSDIDFAAGTIRVIGKGNKHRTVFLSARAAFALRSYIQFRKGAAFVSDRAPHDRLLKSGIEKIVGQIGERSGIGRKLHPHLLRHTFATDCLSRGMQITGIQKVLGHSSLNTTMVYAKANLDDVHTKFTKCIV